MNKKTVCLNMIVKNESKVIQRCLLSVKKLIDAWVIVDTGSTDGTQQIIQETLRDIPGQLYERPWVDFAHNRNEAFDLAQGMGDYLLFIDADEQLQCEDSFHWPPLEKDYYAAKYHHDNNVSQRTLLVNQRLPWRWEGVVHEVIKCSVAIKGTWLDGIINLAPQEGERSRDVKLKYLMDAQILEKELEKDQGNARIVYHLGTSYLAAEKHELALQNFERRAAMGGFDYEVFVSLWYAGLVQEKLHMPPEAFLRSYFQAYQFRPHRIEPLYCAANYYLEAKCYLLAYLVDELALSAPPVHDYYHTQQWIYDYGLKFQWAECCYRLNKFDQAFDAIQELLENPKLPPDYRAICEKNLSLPVFANHRDHHG